MIKQRRTFRRLLFSKDAKARGVIPFARPSIKFVIAFPELHCRRGEGENVGGNDGEREVRNALSRRSIYSAGGGEESQVSLRRPWNSFPENRTVQGGGGVSGSANSCLSQRDLRRGNRDDQTNGST